MPQIITDNDKRFEVKWASDIDTYMGTELMIELAEDTRTIAEIAADFEGVEHFHYDKGDETLNRDFYGFTAIRMIQRTSDKRVHITLYHPTEKGDAM